MSAHTPGPYAVVMPNEHENPSDHVEIHDGFGRTATVYGELGDPETRATAELLAAAPMMYDVILQAANDFAGWRKDQLVAYGLDDIADKLEAVLRTLGSTE